MGLGDIFDIPEEGRIFLFLSAASLTKVIALGRLSQKHKAEKKYAGRVKELKIYPLKSAKPLNVNRMTCTFQGVQGNGIWDRSWMICKQDGTFVTARQESSLVLIKPIARGKHMEFTAPGMESSLMLPLEVPQSEAQTIVDTKVHGQPVKGLDCGEEAAAWISKYLQKPGHRMLYTPEWLEKRLVSNGPSVHHKKAEDKDKVGFQDMCACTLLNTSSMKDLASKIPVNVSEANFRANIIIEGSPEYDEDHFYELHIGSAVFTRIKQTDRCLLTTVNPVTGKRYGNEEPLHTMRSFRMLPGYQTPCFCISLVVAKPGMVSIGDSIHVINDTD